MAGGILQTIMVTMSHLGRFNGLFSKVYYYYYYYYYDYIIIIIIIIIFSTTATTNITNLVVIELLS